MPSRRRRTALAFAGALLAGSLALVSCANDSPTEPAPKVTVHRTVTAVLRDSLGQPVAGASLVWTAQFDSAGLVEVRYATTDADGENLQVLAQGGWIVTTTPGPQAAGASLIVSGDERAPADTQLVRLTTHAASRLRGKVTLAGRTDHRGTIVSGDVGGLAVTDSTGAWAMDGVPLGRWTLWTSQHGFESAVFQVLVITPGSLVIAPPVTVVSEP
jgi:hypothetical protein